MLITEIVLRKIIRDLLSEDIVGAALGAGGEYAKSKVGGGVATGDVESYVGSIQAISDHCKIY